MGVVWQEFAFLVLSTVLILLYSEWDKFFGYPETDYCESGICEKLATTFQVLTDMVQGLSMTWKISIHILPMTMLNFVLVGGINPK